MIDIDFTKFNLKGKKIIIEIPTRETKGSFILINEKQNIQSGWFKILKTGSEVTECKEGDEAFLFFHHPPMFLEELVFQDKDTQERVVSKEEEKAKSVVELIPSLANSAIDLSEFERQFAIVGEYDLVMTR